MTPAKHTLLVQRLRDLAREHELAEDDDGAYHLAHLLDADLLREAVRALAAVPA